MDLWRQEDIVSTDIQGQIQPRLDTYDKEKKQKERGKEGEEDGKQVCVAHT